MCFACATHLYDAKHNRGHAIKTSEEKLYTAVARIANAKAPETAFAFFESYLTALNFPYLAVSYVSNEYTAGAYAPDFMYSNFPKAWR